jgi:F-type H+-transporting ATPase subunit c
MSLSQGQRYIKGGFLMGRKLVFLGLLGLLLLLIAAPAFAQGAAEGSGGGSSHQWLLITSGFSMALAAAGCGIAQSRAISAACEGVSRNPGATDTIRLFFFIGLAFIEFLALLTFVVILIKVVP